MLEAISKQCHSNYLRDVLERMLGDLDSKCLFLQGLAGLLKFFDAFSGSGVALVKLRRY